MEIVLYQCPHPEKKRPRKSINLNLKVIGVGLIVVSLAIFLLTVGPVLITEALYHLEKKNKVFSQEASINVSEIENQIRKREEQEKINQEAASYGISTNFSIVIPRIDTKAEVIANVNPASEKEYQEALKYGVAHALGTGFPGGNDTIYLFAHSSNPLMPTDYSSAVFYLLKELAPKDQIIIFFSGQKFVYEVAQNVITSADDTSWLTQNTGEKLVLQTCWPPGTRQKRLLVIANRLGTK
jgi:LPXTG-site transpeptidase (sortase) family protein